MNTWATTGVYFKNAFPFFCVTVMFRNLSDGLCTDRVSGAARRSRDRRFRAFRKHERMSEAMNMGIVRRHSFK